jgi:hypothetical protein
VQGAQGIQGSIGPVGPPGPSGFSHAWTDENNGKTVGSSYTTVAQVSVPAGTYLFFAKAVVANLDPNTADAACTIGSFNFSHAHLTPTGFAGDTQTLAIQSAATLSAATTVTLDCKFDSSGQAQKSALTAIAVDQLN